MTSSTAMTLSSGIVGLLCLGAVCTGYFVYTFVRRYRYRRPTGQGPLLRVQGQLVGRVGSPGFRTEDGALGSAQQVLLVEQDGRSIPVIAGPEVRGARSGSLLIADGVPVTLIRDERLYRERPVEPALLARRVLVGCWPELRWLQLPVAIGCVLWALGLACWLCCASAAGPSGRLFDRATVDDVVPMGR